MTPSTYNRVMVYKMLWGNLLPTNHEHRDEPPYLVDKRTVLFYVHYIIRGTNGFRTLPRDESSWLSSSSAIEQASLNVESNSRTDCAVVQLITVL